MSTILSGHNVSSMNCALINEALQDPSKQFDSPEDVFINETLSDSDKKKILENWRLDAEALLRAEDENMLSTNLMNKPAKLLQRITNLLAKFD